MLNTSRDRFTGPLRLPIERAVSAHYGRPWQISNFRDMNDLASHPSAILSDGEQAVFVKFNSAANALDQFEVELSGLRYITDRTGVLTPAAVGIVSVPDGVLLILEAVQEVERTPQRWQEIGMALARIHLVKGNNCGHEQRSYFGPLCLDNRPMHDWRSFYIERRLWPNFMLAIDSGHLPTEIIKQVDRLIAILQKRDMPETVPALLHGDAQQNNFISTDKGAVAIDPALYYGNPEMDLAYVDFFQPVPEDIYNGYRELLPIDPGFNERKEQWLIPAYLAMVAVGERGYLDRLDRAVRRYL